LTQGFPRFRLRPAFAGLRFAGLRRGRVPAPIHAQRSTGQMKPRRITQVYFWICALLSPSSLLAILIGGFEFWEILTTGQVTSFDWNTGGTSAAECSDYVTSLSFLLLPTWGLRVWLIHLGTLNGNMKGLRRRWLETAIFNGIILLIVVYFFSVSPKRFEHVLMFTPFIVLSGFWVGYGIWICTGYREQAEENGSANG
jgi:hypothetical protein